MARGRIRTALIVAIGCGGQIASCGEAYAESSAKAVEFCVANAEKPVSETVDLGSAQSIVIDDDWTGFSRLSPINAHYELKRSGSGFSGHADFSAGTRSSGTPTMATEDITIPASAASQFLQAIAKTPVEKGSYSPKRTHTDDYPSVKIELALSAATVTFASQSQGEGRVPWQVVSGGVECVSVSAVPAKALDLLQPYLKPDAKKAVIDKERESLRQGR